MDWSQVLAGSLLRPKVVHRLPGRLRVHLPILHQLPPNSGELPDLIEAVVAVPEQIRSAEVNLTTGNLLVGYDASRATEREVLEYLRELIRLLMKHRDRLGGLAPQDLAASKQYWIEMVQSAVGSRLDPDDQPEVPRHAVA